MPQTTLVVDAPAPRVLEVARAELGAQAGPEGDHHRLEVRFTSGDPVVLRMRATEAEGGGTTVVLESDEPPKVPYFGWFVRPVLRSAFKRALRHGEAVLATARTGGPPPPLPRRPAMSPPATFDPGQATLLAVVCAISAVATYGGSLLSQHAAYVGESFDVSDQALSNAAAVSRVGVLIALFGSALADRQGRRRLLLISLGGVCVANAVAALAPNLLVFTGGQVLMRGFVNSALTIATVMAIEEAPEGARAYSLSLLGLAAGSGYALGVILFPTADLGTEAWRFSFGLSALSVLLLPGFARRLTDTRRYTRLEAQHTSRGRVSEVLDDSYGARFWVLVVASFMFSLFAAPSSQFTNKYLRDERGFSAPDISLFRGITQGVPGVAGVVIGGRLAETRGRRPVAAGFLFAGSLANILFLLFGGVSLWLTSVVAIVFTGVAAPALGAFSGELFPTEIRGTANGLLLVAGVAGSAIGLILTGILRDYMSLGAAIAVMGIPTLVACVALLPLLPESASRPLDEVSPEEHP